jgi:hypothetical protein
MTQDQYYASNEADEAELARLRALERDHDPVTVRHFEVLGVAEG